MRVGDRQLGLTLAAEAVDGSHEADSASGEVLVEAAQFLAAADEEGALPAEVARHALGAAGALDALPEALPQHRHAAADLLALEGGGAFGEPGPDVGEVAVGDGSEPAGIVLLAAARHFDEIDCGDAIGAHELMHLPAQILVPFPAAVVAAEIIGRETDQQDLRAPQRPEDPELPVVHVTDFEGVEEDAQRLGGEAAMVFEDVVAQGGDPAFGVGRRLGRERVILARVAQEDLVGRVFGGHSEGLVRVFRGARSSAPPAAAVATHSRGGAGPPGRRRLHCVGGGFGRPSRGGRGTSEEPMAGRG